MASGPGRLVRRYKWVPGSGSDGPGPVTVPTEYRLVLLDHASTDPGGLAAALNRAYGQDPARLPVDAAQALEILRAPGFCPQASFGLLHGRGETLVGFVLALEAWEEGALRGVIDALGVAPDHRRRGLGLCLVRLCCGALAASGAVVVELAVAGENPAALATYRAAGFIQCPASGPDEPA